MMPLTRDGVCETLYVLCDKDGNKYVNIGEKNDHRTSILNSFFLCSKQVYTTSRLW